ncbi:hypothetical protein OG413_25460 [Streptomyces sp. NBC_01433]|uniref:hypothetical protein n=1 Tax=Streptomyces sp. NBC_01433 TaxID=2903864 RepID=UPI0022556172|nr:hypothetical protein [Streptomyces sp. NBC_01433]MCX4678615.1 hypothetical protein [Streptomyces sp. NBC_01433]
MRNRGEAVGTPAPDSEAPGAPGSIGAPPSPPSPTSTEGGDGGITGGKDTGGARTPTASKPGPEKPEEPAAETPAVVHAAGVSIGRGTSESERQPGGASAAAAQEESAPTGGKAAAVPTTGSGSATAAASSGAAESGAGEPAEAKTPPSTEASKPAESATEASTPASVPSASGAATEAGTTAGAAEATASTTTTVAATATATAAAAASSSPPGGASAAEGGAPERPGRVSRPMVVAAAFAGALLLATPFVVAGAQKDEAKPKSREEAAAWKADGRAGGYVPGTDPDRSEGKRQAGGDDAGKTPARLDKGTGTGGGGDVRADSGVGGKSADGSTGTKDKGTKGEGEGDKTSKSGTGDKAPDTKSPKTPAKAPATGTATKSAPAVVYSGVSGPECDTQRFQKSGYYSDGKEGWATHTGGFGGYGCDGKYLSMPMSGSASKDSGGSATWLFDLPASARKCSISVHVPGSSDIVRVGGNPSYYTVYDRFLPRTSNLVGSYYVRQKERRGTWYNVPGTFAVDAKKLSVQLHDRGEDNNYEHHAISALKVTCTG